MTRSHETQVLIVGAGPVGLTLAIDLARRGIDVTIVELRRAGAPPSVKCNHVSARSMEIFRRLSLAQAIREAGLPADYPNDAAYRTCATGIEFARIPIPSRAERYTATDGPDTWWPTPEPPHRINQIYLEPLLFACATAEPRVRILDRTEFSGFTQDDHGVTAMARSLESGEDVAIAASYLVGCDGGKSRVRHGIGARFDGTPVVQRVQSTCIRAPGLLGRLPGKRAWMYLALNPRRCGTVVAIDGRETWLIHNHLYPGEPEFESIDRDWAIRTILGVGPDFRYDVISTEDWVGRRLVADRFRSGRAFIAGDAAHLWMPYAGYGMNAGIADAADLAWQLAATLKGWAPPAILEAYAAERQPITEQVSRFAMDMALKLMQHRRSIPPEIEWDNQTGEAVRARVGREAYELNVQQYCCGGLNFGYFYDRSPIIAYDGEAPPPYGMAEFTPSTVPGCRAPHLWVGSRSLYDALGPDYTLVRRDPTASAEGLKKAAAERGVPLALLDIDGAAGALYREPLTLVRPDQHVAWRGEEPADPRGLIDRIRGA